MLTCSHMKLDTLQSWHVWSMEWVASSQVRLMAQFEYPHQLRIQKW